MNKHTIGLVLLMACTHSYAQSGGDFSIGKFTVASGGGQSSGGDFSLNGSIGQVDASNELYGEDFSLAGGFWSNTIYSEIIFRNSFE